MEELFMDLKEILGEQLFNDVTAALKGKGKDGKDLSLLINDGISWIPKDEFNKVNEAKKALEAEITNRDTQLKELSEKAKGNAELELKIKELTESNTKSKSEYDTKIKDITISNEIEKALLKSNAKFSDLLVGKFDKSKIELLQDGTVKGIDEQITSLKETYKELFGETKIVGQQPNLNGGNPRHTPELDEMSDADYYKSILKK